MIRILIAVVGSVLIFLAVFNFSGTGEKIKAYRNATKVIVETIDVGSIVSVSFDKSFWGDTTTITSTKGLFTVRGLVSTIMIGNPLVVKTNQIGNKFVCDEVTEVCQSLN